jgi:hypothetical protein
MAIPPVEFLFDVSATMLQDLELSAQNRSANISKSLKIEIDVWIEEMAIAMIARWMRENRQALLSKTSIDIQPKSVDFLAVQNRKQSA